MYLIYNIIAVLLVILALPVFFIRTIREEGFAERLKQSLGRLPEETVAKLAGKEAIWLHAASVGEIVATSPVVKEIKRELPGRPILVSVVTASGYDMAKRIIPEADGIIYFPLDLPFLSRAVISKIRPKVFLLVETELWPNFLKTAKVMKIPVIMVNGRISEKSLNRYSYFRGVLKDMLGTIVQFCMQSPIDAEYIMQLGADPRRVVVTGNTKFDQSYTTLSGEEKAALYHTLLLRESGSIIVAGSTHKGEEEALFTAFSQIIAEFPDSQLVVAPRDIMRAEEIIELAADYNLQAVRRTKLPADRAALLPNIIIIDTIGELGKIYGVADIVYTGGSLVPRGGHNILEPAAHGKPILVGPHMFNFKTSYAMLSDGGVCLTVKDSTDLTATIRSLLNNPEKIREMGQAALAIISENQGASRKSALLLKEVLETAGALETSSAHQRGKGTDHKMPHREAPQIYLYKLVHGEKSGLFADVLLAVLRGMSVVYGLGVSIKLALYRSGILKSYRLPCKVISLGNITVGGTGKTPTAQRLAAIIRDMGHRVVILNRGYRASWKGEVGVVSDGRKIYMSASEAGDEAYLLAKSLPGVPVIIGRNRYITGEYAVNNLQAEIIILDDAYQHWLLQRDLDILLIDALNVFGNNCLLPRGTLREPLANLNRANAFLLTKVDQATEEAKETIRETLAKYNNEALIVESTHTPQCFIEIAEWSKGVASEHVPLTAIQGRSILPFSAIGNPSSFEKTITDLGGLVVDAVRYPDHHDYTMAEMQWIMQKAIDNQVAALITTDKDAVKIPSEFIHSERSLPVYVLSIEVRFHDGCEKFMAMINEVAKPYSECGGM